MDQRLHLYTAVNYATAGEPITMSVFVSTVSGYVPIDVATDQPFTVNFNDYTASQYICSYTDHIFSYAYTGSYNPAVIQLTATVDSQTLTQAFSTIRIDDTSTVTDLTVKRVAIDKQVAMPHSLVYVPTNEIATEKNINKVFDKLYDNFEFLIDLCKTYSIKPEKTGWGGFISFDPSACFETTTTQASALTPNVYGVVGGTNKVVKLNAIPTDDYEFGSSLFQVISTIDKDQAATYTLTSENLWYCSNIPNLAVQTISANIDVSTLSTPITNTSFTHTIVDYFVKDPNTDTEITPLSSDLLVIRSCNTNRIIPTYELSGVILPINATYTPKTIDWNLQEQFKYSPTITSTDTFQNINDIVITSDNVLYLTRGSFVEKFDISTAYREMEFTTQTIDISERFTNAKSIAVTDGNVIHMLDNTRHLVHQYEVDPLIGKVYAVGEWGSLGGASAKTSFYRPNQLFAHNNKIYICDTSNKVLKKYNAQGNWEYTYFNIIPQDSTDTVISACVDKQNNIHVMTENYLISFNSDGDIIDRTSFTFTAPKKLVTNSDGGMLYACCGRQVHRFTLNHELINTFAALTETETSLTDYVSIAVDTHNGVYLTDGRYIVKYLDIPDTLSISSESINSQFWTRDQIYITRNELVDDWVYNRSLRRIAENIEMLYKSLEYKIVPLNDDSVTRLPFDETDTGVFQGLPISLDEFCAIGLNEFVTSEVINRCIDNIQQNIYYTLCIILNCFTTTKAGLVVNFVVAPPVLPNCCWDWDSRETGKCCTPWYWLMDNITWVKAQNKSNGVLLSGGYFAVSEEAAYGLNQINPNITMSFWVSSIQPDTTLTYDVLGFADTSTSNPGVMIGVSGDRIYANVNGLTYGTTGNAVSLISAASGHIVFTKQDTDITFYVNNVENITYTIPDADIISTVLVDDNPIYLSDSFVFGNSEVATASGFQGILHDIWVFDGSVNSTEVNSLYARPAYWQLDYSLRQKAVAHWYGHSVSYWSDSVGDYEAALYSANSATRILLQNYFGSCCDV